MVEKLYTLQHVWPLDCDVVLLEIQPLQEPGHSDKEVKLVLGELQRTCSI